ncbi:MAG: DUF481 domain-containing protein [Hyphomonadaceae bacterium]
MKLSHIFCAATMIVSVPAFADEETPIGWTGEGLVSAGVTTGNTETTDFGLGVNLAREMGLWKTGIEAIADFGDTDGIETKNRFFLAGQLDRQINDRMFGFGRASYEQDQFSGFDSRAFVGGGLGYEVIQNDRSSWVVSGGPGIKIDEVKRIITTDANGAALIIPAETLTSFSVIGTSDYNYAFNDNVSFSNKTDIIYAEESTQLINGLALTAALSNALSARISFDVRHDTNPPIGFEDTDTATRVSLVYGIGK